MSLYIYIEYTFKIQTGILYRVGTSNNKGNVRVKFKVGDDE
jgi:hypothetical protein